MAILIVEDNPVSAKLVEQTLKKYDFETLMTSNGVDALEILSKNPASIDIVITDVMMPEMDGLALAEKIKTSPQYEHIPVIVCTVLRDVENIKKAAAIGCRHYLLKPYRPEELRAKVLECRRHEMKVMRSQAEIMSHFHLKEDQYAEIRASFRQLLESYISFKDEKLKSNNNGDFDLVNIYECAVIFGTERLKILLERHEKGVREKIDSPEINQALISEMSNIVKTLSKWSDYYFNMKRRQSRLVLPSFFVTIIGCNLLLGFKIHLIDYRKEVATWPITSFEKVWFARFAYNSLDPGYDINNYLHLKWIEKKGHFWPYGDEISLPLSVHFFKGCLYLLDDHWIDLIVGNSKSAHLKPDNPAGKHNLELLRMPLFQKENNLDRCIGRKGLLGVELCTGSRDVCCYQN